MAKNKQVNTALIALQIVLLALLWFGVAEWNIILIAPGVFCIGYNIPSLFSKS